LTGWSFGEARKTLGVDVDVGVGISKSTRVSMGTGVRVETPDVGVSGIVGSVEMGVSVVCEEGRLQDDTPMATTRLATQKRFLILSSFSKGIVPVGMIYGNRRLHP
jgi:hypothetical protein